MNKKNLIVIITMILLAAVVAILAFLNRSEEQLSADKIDIYVYGNNVATVALADLQQMDSLTMEKEIISGSGENQSGLFRGVELAELLDSVAAGWQEGAASVNCRAADNFISSFTVDEVLAEGNILVAYELDGQPLAGKDQGGKGPFRLVVRDDAFGNRSTYWLCSIEVE